MKPTKKFRKPKVLAFFEILAILFVFSIFNQANADFSEVPTVSEIFSKTAEAKSKVDYVGKRIVIIWNSPRGDIAFEERVIHKTPSTHIVDFLLPEDIMSPKNRKDRVSERQGNNERGKRRDFRRRRMPPPHELQKLRDIWRKNTQLLLRNYVINVEHGELIAGQKTYLLTINPKVASRPRSKVWLDSQNYTILRMEHYDITGKIDFLSVYTTIDYNTESIERQLKQYQKESQPEKERDKHRPYHIEELSLKEAEEKLEVQIPQPSHLPKGFELQSISMVIYHDNPSVHFRYTDGLSDFSFFVSKVIDEKRERPERRPPNRFRNRHKTVTVKNTQISTMDSGHIRILNWIMKNQSGKMMRLVLISELSQKELIEIAKSLISQK